MTNAAVRRLNNDLKKYDHAKSVATKAASTEKKAEATQKKDVAAQKTALASIDAQEKQLVDSFTQMMTSGQPVDPTVASQDLQKFFALGERRAQTQDKFEHKLASDKTSISNDKKAITKDKKAITSTHKQALKDLKPAEYQLGLKETNKDRKALGLKSVHSVIRPPHPTVGGQVGKWISEAQAILAKHGIPYSKMNAKDLNIIIQHESSGNPNAENDWDSNAAAGHPSIGLMQTIGPTFNAYKLPGHNNIRNPVDNIIAGVRYAVSRYGSISNVPGVVDVHHGRKYVGY